MKKLAVLVLVGALSMTSAFVVSAEEESEAAEDSIAVITMDDMDPELYEGVWVSFVAGFDLYLPADWNVLEVDEESSVIFQAAAPDESGWSVGVTYASAEDLGVEATIDLVEEQLSAEDSGASEVYQALINDIPVVTFVIEENDVTGFAFVGEQGGMYTVMFTPASDEDFQPTAYNMIYSFSLTETEGETEVETEA